MNIYSISISHGKNSSHITYIRLNHPWSINRLRTKALDWLREWLTAERVEPLNVKLKGKMGSVFVQVPWGEKPGFRTHTHTRAYTHALAAHVRSHIVILLHFGLCSTWKHFMLPAVWDELGVAPHRNIGVCRGTVLCGAGEIISIISTLSLVDYICLPLFTLLSLSALISTSVYFCNVIFNFISLSYLCAYPKS